MSRHRSNRSFTNSDDTVIDLAARRRCHLERTGHDPVSVAIGLLADTGHVPNWDTSAYDDPDPDAGWAA